MPFNGSSASFNFSALVEIENGCDDLQADETGIELDRPPESALEASGSNEEKATAAGSLDATTTSSGAAAAAARRLARRAVRRLSEEWFELVLMSFALFGSYLLWRVARRRLANRVAPSATTGAARKRAWRRRRRANAAPKPTSRVIRTVAARDAEERVVIEKAKVQPRPRAAGRGVKLRLVIHLMLVCGAASFTPSSKAELKAATDAWTSDASAAEATYGHVGAWNTSRIACSPECVSGGALEMARCCADETTRIRERAAHGQQQPLDV